MEDLGEHVHYFSNTFDSHQWQPYRSGRVDVVIALFAFLAMAGDLGGSIGPSAVGLAAQNAGNNLQAGMRLGIIFPLVLIIVMILLQRNTAVKQDR